MLRNICTGLGMVALFALVTFGLFAGEDPRATTIDVAAGDAARHGQSDSMGDELFRPAVNYPVGDQPYSVAMGDFNMDGKQDIAIATTDDSITYGVVKVLLGNGDGSFASSGSYSFPGRPSSVAVGDFNRDGKQDLVTLIDAPDNPGYLNVLQGDGTGLSPSWPVTA